MAAALLCGGVAMIPAAAHAEEAKGLLAALNACRTVVDAAARLSCYDKEVEALNGAAARKDVVIVDKAQVKESKKGLFGFNIGKIPLFGGGKDDSDTPEEKSLTAKIVSGRPLADGRWRLTIEGSAVWETTEPLRSTREPKAGAEYHGENVIGSEPIVLLDDSWIPILLDGPIPMDGPNLTVHNEATMTVP